MKEPRLRPYSPDDRAGCLAIFDSNVPEFFAAHERLDFETDLDEATEYFVVEEAGRVVACGGVWLGGDDPPEPRRGGFVWGMVRRDLHARGYGRLLVAARLDRLRELGVRDVQLDTSQHTAPFYARFGFQEVSRVADGYGPGTQRLDMVVRLD